MKNKLIILLLASIGLTEIVLSDTTTTKLGLTKPSIGSSGWGVKWNTNADLIDNNVAVLGSTNSFTANQTMTVLTVSTISAQSLTASTGTVSLLTASTITANNITTTLITASSITATSLVKSPEITIDRTTGNLSRLNFSNAGIVKSSVTWDESIGWLEWSGNTRFGRQSTRYGYGVPPLGYIGIRMTQEIASDGGGGFVAGVDLDPTITGHPVDTNYLTYMNVAGFGITITTHAAVVAASRVSEPQITKLNGSSATVAATMYVHDAPTEGITNAALYVATGDTRLSVSTGDVNSIPLTSFAGSSSITGWSSRSTTELLYKKLGKTVTIYFRLVGTSDSTTTSFTVPYTPTSLATLRFPAKGTDNSVSLSTPSSGILTGGSTTIDFKKDYADAVWTASGSKQVSGQFFYETD